MGTILDYGAALPPTESGFAQTSKLSKRGPGHPEPLPKAGDFRRRQHTEMPAYGLMPPSLAFVIQELDIARAAAADGKIDLEYDRRIRGSGLFLLFQDIRSANGRAHPGVLGSPNNQSETRRPPE